MILPISIFIVILVASIILSRPDKIHDSRQSILNVANALQGHTDWMQELISLDLSGTKGQTVPGNGMFEVRKGKDIYFHMKDIPTMPGTEIFNRKVTYSWDQTREEYPREFLKVVVKIPRKRAGNFQAYILSQKADKPLLPQISDKNVYTNNAEIYAELDRKLNFQQVLDAINKEASFKTISSLPDIIIDSNYIEIQVNDNQLFSVGRSEDQIVKIIQSMFNAASAIDSALDSTH